MLRDVFKVLRALSILCALLGLPFAVLLWLAGAMNTVPRFSGEALAQALPLLILASIFGFSAIRVNRKQNPANATPRFLLFCTISPLILAGILFLTYLEYR